MSTPSAAPALVSSTAIRAFAALTGLTSLGIFAQAVTAGEFVSQEHRGGWIAAHNVIAMITVLLALVTAIFALVAVRRARAGLAWSAVALLVLLVAQTGIGSAITEAHADGLIGVHVPLAFIVFGLTAWLSMKAAQLRRSQERAAA